jgi:hypothetical protein
MFALNSCGCNSHPEPKFLGVIPQTGESEDASERAAVAGFDEIETENLNG